MKIKSQFKLLIFGIVIIPLITITVLPINNYLTSPQRTLLSGYKEIRKIKEIDLTEEDWSIVRKKIESIPPNVQVAFYYNSTILISNIPELKTGMYLTPFEIFEFMKNTNADFDYQFQSPLITKVEMEKNEGLNYRILVISRVPTPEKSKAHKPFFYLQALIFAVLFEFFCLTSVIRLSRVIYKSITVLEQSTLKIANGDLDAEIKMPKNKRLANEITSLVQSLEKMRTSLKDDHERRVKFIMGISHDLRTPVSLIKGYSEAITDGIVSDLDSVRNSLSIINAKADQLETMINDLINYVKLNNTDWKQTLENVRLEPFLTNFAQSALNTSSVYNRKINTFIDVDSSIEVPMDKNLVSRALENILSNAVRYTKDGDSISISAVQEGSVVLLSIADTGIGIEQKDLEHIYDIFYRGTNSRREQGMGIGLSVVKTIIDTLGWNISVTSKTEEGTTFFIRIPFGSGKSEESPAQ
ncbi:MAG: HAMP domain-containing histidine kinase [Treponema sp.]|nr:HAMP domain-containing histidine kinase [Treponema sp.]